MGVFYFKKRVVNLQPATGQFFQLNAIKRAGSTALSSSREVFYSVGDVRDVLIRIQNTNFHWDPDLTRSVLDRKFLCEILCDVFHRTKFKYNNLTGRQIVTFF